MFNRGSALLPDWRRIYLA